MKQEIRELILSKYNNHCAYCGCNLKLKEMQVDHIEPKSRGGEDKIKNYNPSCRQCNFYKSDFNIEQFRFNLKDIHIRIMKPFISRLGLKYGIIEIKPFDGLFYFEK